MQKEEGNKKLGYSLQLNFCWGWVFCFLSLQNSPQKMKIVFMFSAAKKLPLFAVRRSLCPGEKLSQQRLSADLLSHHHGKDVIYSLALFLPRHRTRVETLTSISGYINLSEYMTQLKSPFQPCLLRKKGTVKTCGFSCPCQYFKGHYISWHQCLGFLVSENCGDHL